MGAAILELAQAVATQCPPVNMNSEQAVDKVKTPSDQWLETLPMFMTFVGVETEDALPELFLKIAKANKKEE